MPEYTIKDGKTGRTVTLRGDSPPTEEELTEIFARIPATSEAKAAAPERTWTDTLVDALPAIGGTVGGIIGGVGGTVAGVGVGGVPGAIGGAAVGGAGGEGFKKAINFIRGKSEVGDADENSVMKDIGIEAAKQGAMEIGGQAVNKLILAPAAKAVTKAVFNPGEKVMAKSPTVVTDILDKGVGFSKKGVGKAKALTDSSRKAVDDAVLDYKNTGGTVSRDYLTDALVKNPKKGIKSSYETIAERAEQTPGLKQLGAVEANLVKDHAAKIDPVVMHAIKRSEGNAARTVFAGAENPALQKQIHADLAAGANAGLEAAVPGFSKMNAETAKNLAVLQTVQKALKTHQARPQGISALDRWVLMKALATGSVGYAGAGLPGAIAALGAQHVVGNPRVAASLARGAWGVSKSPLVQSLERATEVAVNEDDAAKKARKAKAPKRF